MFKRLAFIFKLLILAQVGLSQSVSVTTDGGTFLLRYAGITQAFADSDGNTVILYGAKYDRYKTNTNFYTFLNNAECNLIYFMDFRQNNRLIALPPGSVEQVVKTGTRARIFQKLQEATRLLSYDVTEPYDSIAARLEACDIPGIDFTTYAKKTYVSTEISNALDTLDVDPKLRDTISQAHTFVAGDAVYSPSGTWVDSQDDSDTSRVDGIVVEVIDASTFVVQYEGSFALSNAYTVGTPLYVQGDGTISAVDTGRHIQYGFALDANTIHIGAKPNLTADRQFVKDNLQWSETYPYPALTTVRYQGNLYRNISAGVSVGDQPDITPSVWVKLTTVNPASTTYVDGIDRLKTNFKSSIQSPRYSTNDIIKLRDNNAEFQILRSIKSNEIVDSIFITEIYDTSLNTENLFLLSEDFPRPFPFPWRPSGSGTDITFEKDVMVSPLGTFTADKATKTVSSFVRQYLQDTIFANTTYYLSFWFRAGDGMATSGVEMDEIRFLNNGSNYTDPVTVSLTTSDTLWRYYEIAMEQSDIDLLPTGATGADWGCRFDGMPNPSEFSVWGMSLSRNPSEQYIRTTDTKTAKRYRGYSKLINSSQVFEMDKLPEYIGITNAQILQNDTERLQAAYDYCANGNCDYIDIGKGLKVTSLVNVRDGITLISHWSGDIELDDQDSRITVDLNDSTATAFRVVPDSGNPIPLGASFKNIYFDVVSPVNTVIDMESSNKSTLDNILIQGNLLAKTNLRYGREEYEPGERYGAIGNTNRNVKLFQATEQALLLDSIGALNFFYESQFHRSKIGITAENSSLNCYGCHIEKSDSLALVFNGGTLYWLGGYTESPNFDPGLGGNEVGDTIAFHIKKATIAEFKNSSFSTSSETKVYFDVDEDVEEFNLERNYFSGGTLDRLIDINEYATKFEKNGNVFFAPGAMENTIPPDQTRDITNIYPSLIEGSTNRTTNQNTIIRDSVAFSNATLRSKVNHVSNSEAVDSTASFDFNPSRLTLNTDDVANPIDSLVTADKLTLTADIQAKLLNIIPSGLTFETYTRYNLSFWIRPGTESFNDNLIVTIAGSEIIQADTLSSFDPSLKEWQRIDTVIVFSELPASNEITLRFYGDASDYFWLTGVQITQGETVVDYVKTTGSPAPGEIKTKIGDGSDAWIIEGSLSLSENLTVTGTLTAANYEGVKDTDIVVTYTPINYQSDNTFLDSNLEGIDNRLSGIDSIKWEHKFPSDGDTVFLESYATRLHLGPGDVVYIDESPLTRDALLSIVQSSGMSTVLKADGVSNRFYQAGQNNNSIKIYGVGSVKTIIYNSNTNHWYIYNDYKEDVTLFTDYATYQDTITPYPNELIRYDALTSAGTTVILTDNLLPYQKFYMEIVNGDSNAVTLDHPTGGFIRGSTNNDFDPDATETFNSSYDSIILFWDGTDFTIKE